VTKNLEEVAAPCLSVFAQDRQRPERSNMFLAGIIIFWIFPNPVRLSGPRLPVTTYFKLRFPNYLLPCIAVAICSFIVHIRVASLRLRAGSFKFSECLILRGGSLDGAGAARNLRTHRTRMDPLADVTGGTDSVNILLETSCQSGVWRL
jgi:hypothetical protein